MPQLLYLAYKTPIQMDKNQLYRETLGYVKKRYGIEDHEYTKTRTKTIKSGHASLITYLY